MRKGKRNVLEHSNCDLAAFTSLVETYQSPLYNLCYRMLSDKQEAEDAAQETFLRAYRQFHRYDPSRPLQPWLFAIACHHCIDQLRKRKRMVWLDVDDESQQIALRETAPGPEDLVVKRELDKEVQNLLDELAPKDRVAIILRYWYEFSDQEIAYATATSSSSVKSRLHRARRALAEKLRPAETKRVGSCSMTGVT
jgi:RNA polymerase sigma-70 factor (ECF subfamily)